MIYLDRPQASVEWDEADKTVRIAWHGYAEGEDYRDILNAALALLELKSACRLVADLRKSKAVTAADQEWVNTVWTSKATQVGLKLTALLVPESSIAKMSVDRMRARYVPPSGGGVAYFSTMEEAKAWLRRSPL